MEDLEDQQLVVPREVVGEEPSRAGRAGQVPEAAVAAGAAAGELLSLVAEAAGRATGTAPPANLAPTSPPERAALSAALLAGMAEEAAASVRAKALGAVLLARAVTPQCCRSSRPETQRCG